MRTSLREHQEESGDQAKFQAAVDGFLRLEAATAQLTSGLSSLSYPFEHALGPITVGQYATADLPPLGDLSDGALPRARAVLQRLFLLYQRTLARLAVIALSAERTAARSGAPERA